MSWRCQQTQVTWYHAIYTVWSILSLSRAWQYVEWYSLVNTMPVYPLVMSIMSMVDNMPVYGLVKSILAQLGQYYACLWSGEVDTVWLMRCFFVDWWSQLMQFNHNCNACLWADEVNQQSLVNTEPVYVLMSTVRVWSIPCLFMFWRCLMTEFGQYHAS